MGDELSGLLEIFTKVKEAGGQATLTAATHEGKTNIKLEIVSPPPATAPPPLQPVPGQRRCRHRGAAARAKGCWPPGDYLGSASTCLPILCPSCSRRSQWPSWPPTAAWPPPSSVSPSLPHLPPLPISVQRAEQGHVSGEAAISAMEQGHVSDEAAISAIIWQPQYWRPPPFPTTWTSPTSPSSSCLHTVDKHKLESESSTLGWHVLWTHLDVWLWNSKHCRGSDRSCERKEELGFLRGHAPAVAPQHPPPLAGPRTHAHRPPAVLPTDGCSDSEYDMDECFEWPVVFPGQDRCAMAMSTTSNMSKVPKNGEKTLYPEKFCNNFVPVLVSRKYYVVNRRWKYVQRYKYLWCCKYLRRRKY